MCTHGSKKLYPKIKYEILTDFFIRLDHGTIQQREREVVCCMPLHVTPHFISFFLQKFERKLEYSNGQLFILCRLCITQKNV